MFSTDTLHNVAGAGTLVTVGTAVSQILPHVNSGLIGGIVSLATVVLQIWNNIRLKKKAVNS